jgi:hypothetical protein
VYQVRGYGGSVPAFRVEAREALKVAERDRRAHEASQRSETLNPRGAACWVPFGSNVGLVAIARCCPVILWGKDLFAGASPDPPLNVHTGKLDAHPLEFQSA